VAFARQHRLSEHQLITVHVRQGNGEKGDFRNKGRGNTVGDLAQIVNDQIHRVVNSSTLNKQGRDWKVFVATDNEAVIEALRNISEIEVISKQQTRPGQGEGVLMGQWGSDNPSDCVGAMRDSIVDMQLLSMGQVLLVPVYSSFNQLPQVLVKANQGVVCGTLKDAVWRCINGADETIQL